MPSPAACRRHKHHGDRPASRRRAKRAAFRLRASHTRSRRRRRRAARSSHREGAGITAMLRRLGCKPEGLPPASLAIMSPQAPAASTRIGAANSPAGVRAARASRCVRSFAPPRCKRSRRLARETGADNPDAAGRHRYRRCRDRAARTSHILFQQANAAMSFRHRDFLETWLPARTARLTLLIGGNEENTVSRGSEEAGR